MCTCSAVVVVYGGPGKQRSSAESICIACPVLISIRHPQLKPYLSPRTHARYFCPSFGGGGYPTWVPRAVAEGLCESKTRDELMAGGPLPPNFKVLVYGNSYMRQVMVGWLVG